MTSRLADDKLPSELVLSLEICLYICASRLRPNNNLSIRKVTEFLQSDFQMIVKCERTVREASAESEHKTITKI